MNSTATQIANLSAEKRALLSKLLKNKGKVNADAIPRRHRENGLPLSFAQERMWFLAQLDPENPNYNVAGAIRISGELNISLLEQCVNEVVRRHEVLRTAFGIANGQTEQVVLDTISVPLSLVDLSCLPLHDLDAEQDKLIKRELQKPFVLTAAEPLLRMTLLLIKPQEFMLLLSMHHIVSDEWSLRLLISEIGQLYQALMKGEPSLLPELAIQYADYASWQRSKLVGEARDKQLGYWLNFLGGVPQVLTLPSDRPRPPIRTNRGAVYSMALPKALSDGIMRLSRALDMTLFMTLMGAFSLLLHRYTSMDDLCIGYPATNRNKPELEKLIGFFVNTLVLRTQADGNPRLADFLAEVRRNLLDAKKHQDFPFEQLVEELHPERNLGHHPLFQVMFNYQSSSMDLPEIPGLNFQLLEAGSTTAKFDLTLLATKTDDSIVCTFEYSTELFEEKTIARMAGHFETLLAGMVSQPDSRISELPLLTQLERKQVLVDWNATTADYPAGQSLHALFEAQVKKTPDALAVMFERQSLSYAELNSKANRLAHYLCDQGVGPDVLVGVCLERSLEMVIGLLGILKAGGAYVPLDPGYPQDRLDFMLHDVGAPIVLTQEACRGKLAASAAAVLCLDSEWGVVEGASDANPGIPLMPENLAYCIYTSGSTGQPKGAGVPHQGIVNRLQWMQAQYSLDQSDRILQKTPYSFDVSVWEFFWTLMTGAKLIVARPDEHKDSLALIDTIVDRQVTTIHFVPSMLQAFIDTPGVENCASLKRIVCSGEALPADLAVRFRQKIQAELHNLYGPTEASVDVSYWACLPDSAETAIPIGRPIANIELYILDRQLNPVPVGIPGELHIGGIGLGRGYLNRPGLTAEKFIPNPYDTSGSRLYKTGDLVRYRPDGNIDYLGRIDHQVKIRGFRIELGEIEARLLDVPDIQEAVVIAREDQSGDKRLVAYLVAATTDAVDIETLKSRLRQILPDYMVPSAFVVLESMPLSANGKLDRKRLPQPDMSGMSANRYVAPRTATEHILAGIWADVLGIEKVGVEDDFFELGGHSLLAAQMSFAVQKEFNLKLSLRMFLETPTIAAQARLIELGESDEASVDIESDAVLD
ncbi:MAG: amino acid adenylation domain-containing protein, partial [Methylobacter sp.]